MPPSRPSSSLFPSLFPAERWNIPSQARIGYTFADFLRCGKRGNLTLLIRRHPPVPYQHSPSFQGKQLVLPAWLRLGEFQALETQREDFCRRWWQQGLVYGRWAPIASVHRW